MKKSSILIPMIRGYLFIVQDLRESYHEKYRVMEADRIAGRIRKTFGGHFDESDEQSCANVIKAVMQDEPEPKTRTAVPKRNPQAEREAWEKRIIAEAKARREREERLRNTEWF